MMPEANVETGMPTYEFTETTELPNLHPVASERSSPYRVTTVPPEVVPAVGVAEKT
jgi:hypothetical protein